MDVEPQNLDFQCLKAYIIKNSGKRNNRMNNNPDKWPKSKAISKRIIFLENAKHIIQMNKNHINVKIQTNTIDFMNNHITTTTKGRWCSDFLSIDYL